ncbi:hypothetical protein BOX15_Mlig022857g3 [Macrostomum lignano]|uniref:Uncharacterized protein n=1 Tax=Macrostomum lignano TaxID=282301 RepID=A0A267EBB8_9PLAT|nr:hypothetical protein BOX15_Mlig022857g3 [Macrostomum lignano]
MDSPERLDLSLHSFADLDHRVWHFNIAFIGSSRAGKTKLLQRFVDSQYSDIYSRTSEISFVSKSVSLGQNHVVFQCWDTPGSAPSASCLDSRLAQLHAVFIVFDGSRDAIADLEHWHHLALKSPSSSSASTPPLLVLVANKTDLGCHQATMTRARDLCRAANGVMFSLSVLADEENLEVDAMMLEVGKVLTERCVKSAPPAPAAAPSPQPVQQTSALTSSGTPQSNSPHSKKSSASSTQQQQNFVDKAQGDGVDKPAEDGDASSKTVKDHGEEKTDWWSRLCCCRLCW